MLQDSLEQGSWIDGLSGGYPQATTSWFAKTFEMKKKSDFGVNQMLKQLPRNGNIPPRDLSSRIPSTIRSWEK